MEEEKREIDNWVEASQDQIDVLQMEIDAIMADDLEIDQIDNRVDEDIPVDDTKLIEWKQKKVGQEEED